MNLPNLNSFHVDSDKFKFGFDPTQRVLFIQLLSYFSSVLSSAPFPPAMIGVMDICDILSWQFKAHRPCIDTEEALCRSVPGIYIIFPTLQLNKPHTHTKKRDFFLPIRIGFNFFTLLSPHHDFFSFNFAIFMACFSAVIAETPWGASRGVAMDSAGSPISNVGHSASRYAGRRGGGVTSSSTMFVKNMANGAERHQLAFQQQFHV